MFEKIKKYSNIENFKKKILNGILIDIMVFLYLYLIRMDIFRDYQFI